MKLDAPVHGTSGRQVLLDVRGLSVDYVLPGQPALHAVSDVSFSLRPGEVLGVVGESGCGKTTLMLSLLRLLPVTGRIVAGQAFFMGRDLLALSEREMAAVRWKGISMIFQGAMNALNPVRTIGDQIAEAIALHTDARAKDELGRRVGALLELVGIAPDRKDQYPHQYSGGMRQRAMIAMALACDPQVVIADEPTTALDVMMQAQILELLADLREKLGLAIVFVTHDLGVVAEVADTVLVMYAGVTAEYAAVDRIYNHPEHPYTRELLKAFPDLSKPTGKLAAIPGHPPRLDALPPGCHFAPRCPAAFGRCSRERPELYPVREGHYSRCFLAEAG